ncbi:DNA-methyltransferase [Nocardia thailandica]|uniref:DNA-methyltransferase n=1 Tax=Nocardia thailandica TaxID=257275 RepID=UPI000312595C|nr:site-specific DNA-methyltransferase [Nocardia thailandica]
MAAPYYESGNIRLFHGSCLDNSEWLDAETLITDPPYGMSYTGRGGRKTLIAGDDTTEIRDQALAAWFTRNPGSTAAVFGTWRIPRPPNPKLVLVWDKTDGTGPGMGDLACAFGSSHEEIYLWGRWPKGTHRRIGSVLRTSVGMSSLARKVGHPTPKPVTLMELLIDRSEGAIADPFAGSGSTLVAARNLGRPATGVELEERYCELIARRLEQEPPTELAAAA